MKEVFFYTSKRGKHYKVTVDHERKIGFPSDQRKLYDGALTWMPCNATLELEGAIKAKYGSDYRMYV